MAGGEEVRKESWNPNTINKLLRLEEVVVVEEKVVVDVLEGTGVSVEEEVVDNEYDAGMMQEDGISPPTICSRPRLRHLPTSRYTTAPTRRLLFARFAS